MSPSQSATRFIPTTTTSPPPRRQPIRMNQIAIGCIVWLKHAEESTSATVRNRGVECDRAEPSSNIESDMTYPSSCTSNGPHWRCSAWCRLDTKGFGHPAVIVKVDGPTKRLSFVHTTATKFEGNRAKNRSFNVFSPIGHASKIPGGLSFPNSRYWIQVKNQNFMDKPTWMCLPHVYTLDVSHFETWNFGEDAVPCHTRLDKQSFDNLLERLAWPPLKYT